MTRTKRTRRERLAEALELLRQTQRDGIIRSGMLPPRVQTLLAKAGYLQEIIKGWHHFSSPAAPIGSSQWQAHFWAFVAQYLESRFQDDYSLAAEPSLLLGTGLTKIPEQLTVIVSRVDNNLVRLPHGCSIYPLRLASGTIPGERVKINGVWCMSLESALAQAPAGFFTKHPDLAATALSLANPSGVLGHLLSREATVFGGRLAAAYSHIGRADESDQILKTMRRIGFNVVPSNPFDKPVPMSGGSRTKSPYVLRIRAMWAAMREEVARAFPEPPGVGKGKGSSAYLQSVDDVYKLDAYNSLSIEGYAVDDDLIDRVRQKNYEAGNLRPDKHQSDALAARGYYEAFQLVRESIARVLDGEDAAAVVRRTLRDWNYAMCSPMIRAGVMKPTEAVGYRNNVVLINGSEHVPPPSEAVIDSMEGLFDLLDSESHPAVRAVLGHFLVGFIHPYPDRNGRLSRFLMNVMLASGGYPWTVVRVEERRRYMGALEEASCRGNIGPFAKFIADQMAVAEGR